MAKALVEHNIQVDFLFSGRKPEDFFDMSVLGSIASKQDDFTRTLGESISRKRKQNCSLSLLDIKRWIELL